ncbi:C45 family autoproteolytic acyltransferase/hydrolase [Paucibacter sp. B2R-40]|uniref:C45 family autoproteolytic acyltransferase/hydolase n=1 Tax=Paucibacter sp. B2R-40 TaxID=2893554 RepID=UPI0021E3D378|nr:C45 family autoproteolytic acyltransferase/hydolase [Paucibacter sp. B2R-40]MCV2355564.1 C45 family autoproteolytic acyltransferase/hydrolase [Paucibacter sp. B2R-40]
MSVIKMQPLKETAKRCGSPSSSIECRGALRKHMPELLTSYDHVCDLVGDDELAHQILSHYRPPPLRLGCTQAVWLGSEGPALVRNYDFPIQTVSGHFESTSWFGREVVSKAQRPWGGCLDGMNAAGLVASATFGGSRAQGLGFSIILILRYVLETCSSVAEGIEALCRIPIALSQNVTLLDASGEYATLFLGPDRIPAVSKVAVCTKHQEHHAPIGTADTTETVLRQQTALLALEDPEMTLENLTASFLRPPLYRRNQKSSTVYSAVSHPDLAEPTLAAYFGPKNPPIPVSIHSAVPIERGHLFRFRLAACSDSHWLAEAGSVNSNWVGSQRQQVTE